MVFRNFTGATLFTALVNKTVSKVKDMPNGVKPNQFKSKVAVICKEFGGSKYLPEHVEVKFNSIADRETFTEVFSKLTTSKAE